MSLVDKTDVKNHLSARHRTQIHLAPPPGRPDEADIPREDPAAADPNSSSSSTGPLTPSKIPQGSSE
jgi:hypothetical protein